MGTTADKLNKLLQTKQAIKQAIINKGVEVADDTVFADYPSKIESIESGGGGDPYYEALFLQRTKNNTDLAGLFYDSPAKTLDLSKLNTSNATDMESMFYNCTLLTSLDLSNFDTSNVIYMTFMFRNCRTLTSLDLSNLNTSKVIMMSSMFYSCVSLTSIDLSNWDTSKVTNMTEMFYYCTSLTSLKGLNNWNIDKVTNIKDMFSYCQSLTSLDVSAWNVGHITASYYFGGAFNNCTALVDFYPPQNINAQMDVSKSTALSHDSLMRIINNLMTTTSTKKLILGATNLAKLSDEEKAIATGKGWTLA
jgi:surface protein